jgi:hypothetical protein
MRGARVKLKCTGTAGYACNALAARFPSGASYPYTPAQNQTVWLLAA